MLVNIAGVRERKKVNNASVRFQEEEVQTRREGSITGTQQRRGAVCGGGESTGKHFGADVFVRAAGGTHLPDSSQRTPASLKSLSFSPCGRTLLHTLTSEPDSLAESMPDRNSGSTLYRTGATPGIGRSVAPSVAPWQVHHGPGEGWVRAGHVCTAPVSTTHADTHKQENVWLSWGLTQVIYVYRLKHKCRIPAHQQLILDQFDHLGISQFGRKQQSRFNWL